MPLPENKKDIQRFLGMTNYLCKFIPEYAEVTTPLRKLLHNDILWSFDKPQIEAVEKLKQTITSLPILKFYDPSKEIKITTDASKHGLGAVLQQKHNETWLPVSYASRSTTSAEQNYCPIELETLSIVFACSKFHQFIYGKFLIENDHKPLRQIF